MVQLPEKESNVRLTNAQILRRLYLDIKHECEDTSRLVVLEAYAKINAKYIRSPSNYPDARQIAMNQLRQQFNLVSGLFLFFVHISIIVLYRLLHIR